MKKAITGKAPKVGSKEWVIQCRERKEYNKKLNQMENTKPKHSNSPLSFRYHLYKTGNYKAIYRGSDDGITDIKQEYDDSFSVYDNNLSKEVPWIIDESGLIITYNRGSEHKRDVLLIKK